DLDHYMGGDLSVSLTGDVQQIDGLTKTSQRLLRRLLTNPGDYIWHPTYGAGLGKKIGSTLSVREITGVIQSNIFLEAAVARLPAPVISVTPIPNGVSVRIKFFDSGVGAAGALAFDLNR
ncbi:MAG: phage tail protein, partial [Polaromonas sp.]|nr:phage tail protein [Polaromonas sp.]